MSCAFLPPSLHLSTQSSNSHQTLTVELPAYSFSTCSSHNSHVTFQLPRPSVAPNSLVSLKRTFCLCNMHQDIMLIPYELGFPAGSTGKECACDPGNPGSIPGLGRSSGEGIGYPLQYVWASLVAQLVKESACNVSSFPGLGRSPGGEHSNPLWHSFLRSLADFIPWGLKGLDMTEWLIAQQPLNQINGDNQVDESEKAGMVHTITAGSDKGAINAFQSRAPPRV